MLANDFQTPKKDRYRGSAALVLDNISINIGLPGPVESSGSKTHGDNVRLELHPAGTSLRIMQYPVFDLGGSHVLFEIPIRDVMFSPGEDLIKGEQSKFRIFTKSSVEPRVVIEVAGLIGDSVHLANVRSWCTIPFQSLPAGSVMEIRDRNLENDVSRTAQFVRFLKKHSSELHISKDKGPHLYGGSIYTDEVEMPKYGSPGWDLETKGYGRPNLTAEYAADVQNAALAQKMKSASNLRSDAFARMEPVQKWQDFTQYSNKLSPTASKHSNAASLDIDEWHDAVRECWKEKAAQTRYKPSAVYAAIQQRGGCQSRIDNNKKANGINFTTESGWTAGLVSPISKTSNVTERLEKGGSLFRPMDPDAWKQYIPGADKIFKGSESKDHEC